MGFIPMGVIMETIKKHDIVIPEGQILIDLYNVITKKHDIQMVKNMFVTVGKNSLADRLKGATDKGIITYCALGTGTNAPALGNTTLQTELGRKLISVRSVSGNIATFQTFFTTAEVIGTLREAGLFGDDASTTANTGTLFCRAAINRVKSSNDTLTLSWAVTIG